MVITKGSGRIAEVAARFSLDSMPGKQMAIDADMSAGLIDEKTARRRRRDLEEESSFYGAMDGAAKFVRGDAIAGLIITGINIVGGLAIGLISHHMAFADAVATFTTLSAGDGLVAQIPALLVSTAAGIVVTKGSIEGTADVALVSSTGPRSEAAGDGGGRGDACSACCPACRLCRSWRSPVWRAARRGCATNIRSAPPDAAAATPVATEPPIGESLRMDMIRLELGYGLLALAGGDGPRLTEQIKSLRRTIAADMGFVLPPVRIQDNMRLGPTEYVISVKEIEAGRGELRPLMLLIMDPKGGTPQLAGEATREPAFGLPAMWIDPSLREEALFRGCTVVDAPTVLSTHLTEIVRQNVAELLSYAETRKLLDELPAEHQKLVTDMIPATISVGAVQRVLQSLLEERVSIRDLPTILEGIQEACGAPSRAIPAIVAHVRARLARQISDQHTGSAGYIPLLTLVAGLGGGVRQISGRAAGGTATRDGAGEIAGIRAQAERGLREGRLGRRIAGCAEQRCDPRPCPRDCRAGQTRHGGAVTTGDISTRADQDGGDGVKTNAEFNEVPRRVTMRLPRPLETDK